MNRTREYVGIKLIHYAHEPLGTIIDADQEKDVAARFKPAGLWISVEDGNGWREWCEAEGYGLGWLNVYEITLAPDANILYLKTLADIDRFSREYIPEDLPSFCSYPDWPEIAEQYDGIIIAPYQWERRFHDSSRWYYGWDCSSGCIWKASAITAVTEVALS